MVRGLACLFLARTLHAAVNFVPPRFVTFLLKKFVSFWFMPLPLSLTLLVIGACLLFSARRARLGRALVIAGVAVLLIFGNKAISAALIHPLERDYPSLPEFTATAAIPQTIAQCRFIVVLGGGHGDAPGFSSINKLSQSARARLSEGVRLAHALPHASLVLSGRGAPGEPSHAAILARAAESLGIDRARLVLLETPRDTHDESLAIRELAGDEAVILVTSAWHLPRALGLMRGAGVTAVPAPCDHMTRPGERLAWNNFLWDSDSIGRSSRAIAERLGRAWAFLRGQLG